VKDDETLLSFGSMLAVLDKILKKEVITNCIDLGGWGESWIPLISYYCIVIQILVTV